MAWLLPYRTPCPGISSGCASRLCFVALIEFSAITAHAQPPQRKLDKLDERLSRSVRAGDVDTKRVIIRTIANGVPSLTSALTARRHAVVRAHRSINALTARVPAAALTDLAQLPYVESISIDAVVKAEDYLPDSSLRGTLALPLYTPGGDGVGVAVIDSGIEAGPDFEDRIVAFYDFTEGGRAEPPTDDYGHGTHVAGLIAGDGGQSNRRYRGVAHKSRLIGLKVLDQNGAGYTSDVINAIEFVTANKEQLGVDIINLSLGHPILEPAATDPLVQAVEARGARGHHRRRRCRQLRCVAGDRRAGVCGHSESGQCAVGDHRRIRQDIRDRQTQRRSRGGIQLARTHLVRRCSETRCDRSRSWSGVGGCDGRAGSMRTIRH